jgi:molybdopterin-binding protein
MKISARNQLRGTVRRLMTGPVHTEVQLELPGGQLLTSVITTASAESLELSEGQAAFAIVKSSHVMIGVDAE